MVEGRWVSGAKARCLGWFLARFQGLRGSGDFGFLGVEGLVVEFWVVLGKFVCLYEKLG